MLRHWQVLAVLCLLSCLALPVLSAEQDPRAADTLLKEAIQLRDGEGSTSRDRRLAAGLLFEAAGIKLKRTRPAGAGKSAAANSTAVTSAAGSAGRDVVPGFSEFEFAGELHAGALRELAKSFQLGKGVEANQQLSLELYRRAAELGDPEAQGQMGVRHAFGLQDAQSVDGAAIREFGQADEQQALLQYYFAAANGDNLARLALGYRHRYGLGVPESCWTAVSYYQPAAEAALEAASEPGGGLPHIERIRLNVMSEMGLKADRHKEVVQYYQYSADHGNVDAQTAVGQVLNFGTHGVTRNHAAAMGYLQRAAAAGDGEAMAHLGHMYASGLGAAKDYARALHWFRQAAAKQSGPGLYGLGYLYLSGQGVAPNADKAFKYFTAAAEQGNADAHFYLGSMHLNGQGVRRKSAARAFHYFYLAANAGHAQAMYNAAMMQLAGRGTPRACKPALLLLKSLAERGPWAAALQSGHEAFFRGAYTQALLQYLAAAEMGLELGQSNAAWMLDRGYGHTGPNAAAVKFGLHRRSAEQGNVASLLLMGDSFFYADGVGQDWGRASAIYYEAYQERSAEAMFDLGFMHEFGAGVPQDLALARRFYDMAAHTMPEAALAVGLAKTWLALHSAWEGLLPWLPARLAATGAGLWTLRPKLMEQGGGVLAGLMPKWLAMHWESLSWRVADFAGLSVDWSEISDVGETAVLVTLLVVLWLVLKLRHQRAMGAAARQGGAAAAGAGAAGGAAGAVGVNGGGGVNGAGGVNGGGGGGAAVEGRVNGAFALARQVAQHAVRAAEVAQQEQQLEGDWRREQVHAQGQRMVDDLVRRREMRARLQQLEEMERQQPGLRQRLSAAREAARVAGEAAGAAAGGAGAAAAGGGGEGQERAAGSGGAQEAEDGQPQQQ